MGNKPNMLVLLSPGFARDEADSTCLPSQQIFIHALQKKFPALEIVILSFQYPFSSSPYYWHSSRVIPFNGMKNGIKARLHLWYRVWHILRELKKANNVIGLFSFWCGECAFIGRWFGTLYRLKHFCWISGQDARSGNRYVRLIRPKSSMLVAMSDFLQHEFAENYGVKPAYVVPIGIEAPGIIHPFQKRKLDILGVGSLITLKQFDIFIDIIKSLSASFPAITSMICGKGPEKEHLQSLINGKQLTENVVLAGEKTHTEILDLMQQSRIFLHTSSYEGFGAVCIEALGAGCHVISFVKPMRRDIDHWHIVDTKDQMAQKAIELLHNATLAHEPVVPYKMEDSAVSIMRLFDYSEPTTS
jgi:glycosyltransferase involved in cell wall biosynthesis